MSETVETGSHIQLNFPCTNNLTDADTIIIPALMTRHKSLAVLTDIPTGHFQRIVIDLVVPKGAVAHTDSFTARNGTTVKIIDYQFGPISAKSKTISFADSKPPRIEGQVTFLGIQIL